MPDLVEPLSLWRETSAPAPDPLRLARAVTAEVAIVGGGYTGLSAALAAT
jgi:gamma-glutamylputrescine oxidase